MSQVSPETFDFVPNSLSSELKRGSASPSNRLIHESITSESRKILHTSSMFNEKQLLIRIYLNIIKVTARYQEIERSTQKYNAIP